MEIQDKRDARESTGARDPPPPGFTRLSGLCLLYWGSNAGELSLRGTLQITSVSSYKLFTSVWGGGGGGGTHLSVQKAVEDSDHKALRGEENR